MRPSDNPSFLIVTLRKKKRITQAQLGGLLGVGQTQVSKWETGAANPPVEAWMGMGNIADPEDAEAYYVAAGMEERRAMGISKALQNVLRLIETQDASVRTRIERQIVGLELDEQLERAIQAVLELPPPAKGTPRTVKLADEDRALLDETMKAIEKMKSWPKGENSK